MTLSEEHLQVLMQGLWFKSLPQELREQLLVRSKLKTYASRESLFLRGDGFDAVYAVLEGSVRLSGLDWLGKVAILL